MLMIGLQVCLRCYLLTHGYSFQWTQLPLVPSDRGKSSPFDFSDLRMNLFEEGRNDTSHRGPTQAQERDGLKLPQGPITGSKAREIHMKLNGTIQDFISNALDAYTKENAKSRFTFLFSRNSRNRILVQFCCFERFQESRKSRFQILEILVQETESCS